MRFHPLLVATMMLGLAAMTSPPILRANPAPGSSETPGSDLWLEARITTTLTLNEHLHPFLLEVMVRQGTVILRGNVDTDEQRALAGQLAASVSNHAAIENHIRVAPGAGTPASNGIVRFFQDTGITTQFRMALLWNKTSRGPDVQIDTNDGIVTLRGNVRNTRERQRIEQIARNISGVRKIDNRIQIAPEDTLSARTSKLMTDMGQGVSDAWITTRAIASLRLDRDINDSDIRVRTRHGVVTLHGHVPQESQKQEVTQRIQAISGVKEVTNQLDVREPHSA